MDDIKAMIYTSTIRREDTGCWEWKGTKTPHNYGLVYDPRHKRMIRAHRHAYEAFKGPIPEGMIVCHSCDNPPCCNPDHLWLGTHADNMTDKKLKGRAPSQKGEEHGRALLTEEQVHEIRRRKWFGGESAYKLADEFGISKTTARKIVNLQTWTHIPIIMEWVFTTDSTTNYGKGPS